MCVKRGIIDDKQGANPLIFDFEMPLAKCFLIALRCVNQDDDTLAERTNRLLCKIGKWCECGGLGEGVLSHMRISGLRTAQNPKSKPKMISFMYKTEFVSDVLSLFITKLIFLMKILIDDFWIVVHECYPTYVLSFRATIPLPLRPLAGRAIR